MQILRLYPANAYANGVGRSGTDARPDGMRDCGAADRAHRGAVDAYIQYLWGDGIVSRGVLHDSRAYMCFAAVDGEVLLGGLVYRIDGAQCEALALFSLIQGQGVGTALLDAVKETARAAGCRRFWLITTNDNTHAIRFYQRYGFRLGAVHIDAMDECRRLKPISALGEDGIPIQHEFEFEIALA